MGNRDQGVRGRLGEGGDRLQDGRRGPPGQVRGAAEGQGRRDQEDQVLRPRHTQAGQVVARQGRGQGGPLSARAGALVLRRVHTPALTTSPTDGATRLHCIFTLPVLVL